MTSLWSDQKEPWPRVRRAKHCKPFKEFDTPIHYNFLEDLLEYMQKSLKER